MPFHPYDLSRLRRAPCLFHPVAQLFAQRVQHGERVKRGHRFDAQREELLLNGREMRQGQWELQGAGRPRWNRRQEALFSSSDRRGRRFQLSEDALCVLDHGRRQPGQAGDVDPVAPIRAAVGSGSI